MSGRREEQNRRRMHEVESWTEAGGIQGRGRKRRMEIMRKRIRKTLENSRVKNTAGMIIESIDVKNVNPKNKKR